jgi:hypothetical protein
MAGPARCPGRPGLPGVHHRAGRRGPRGPAGVPALAGRRRRGQAGPVCGRAAPLLPPPAGRRRPDPGAARPGAHPGRGAADPGPGRRPGRRARADRPPARTARKQGREQLTRVGRGYAPLPGGARLPGRPGGGLPPASSRSRASSACSCRVPPAGQDPADAGQVQPVGGQRADLGQLLDVPAGVPAGAARAAGRVQQPFPLVDPQRLRVQPGQLRGHRDAEQAPVQVCPARAHHGRPRSRARYRRASPASTASLMSSRPSRRPEVPGGGLPPGPGPPAAAAPASPPAGSPGPERLAAVP